MRHQSFDLESATPLSSPQAALHPALHASLYEGIARRELAVIDMARADGPRSADPDLLTVRLARILFGIAAPRPLANERLDAIRRFAVAAWFSALVPKARLEALFEAGISHDQAWQMLAYVARRRGVMPQVESWPA